MMKNSVIESNSHDYLKDISLRKESHPLCKKCKKIAIPPYLLGVNQKEWEKGANRNGG
jgi:hypothetical protein